MKKVLSLIVALVLVLCSVSALAANSKSNNDIANVKTAKSALVIEIVDELPEDVAALKETFAAAAEAGDVLSALPEEIKAKLPEVATRINEFVALLVSGYEDEMGDVSATFTFETLYTEGQTVVGALFVGGEWALIEGKVNADGSVEFTFPADLAAKLNGKTVAFALISD